MKSEYKILIALIITVIGLAFLINSLTNEVDIFIKEYSKPDTTISCVNGKCDTTITYKSSVFNR